MTTKYFLAAAIVLSSACNTNTNAKQMTHDSSQEAIKVLYQDSFYSQPANRHKRDELIKRILLEQNETEKKNYESKKLNNKKAPPK